MKTWRNWLLVSVLLSVPAVSHGDPGNNYCITPAFITANIKPNLLLMIDNSSSMYDLAYVDRGKRHCAPTETSKECKFDSDCTTAGDTCSVVERQPSYCYDETYRSDTNYVGYFDLDTTYTYRSDSDDFAATSAFPAGCPTSATNTTKTIPNTLCVEYDKDKALVSFVAKGRYLNWLVSSKLDVEKKILTGGKYNGSSLVNESRGCIGYGFVKDVNTASFVNYPDGAANPNDSLELTFTITGEENPYSSTAPSPGGQTYINLFGGAAFNYADCQDAIKVLTDPNTNSPAEIKKAVDSCLSSTSAPTGTCSKASLSCGSNSDCYLSPSSSATFVCTKNPSLSCGGLSDTTTCKVASRNSCQGNTSIACTTDTQCQNIFVPTVSGKCSLSNAFYTGTFGKNDVPTAKVCAADSECTFKSRGTTFTANAGACVGLVPSSYQDYSPCVVTAARDDGPCTNNYVGDCIVTAQQAATKTKVTFQQSMQECWKIQGTTQYPPNYGFPNMNTVKNSCPDIYASYKTCHNNHLKQCSRDSDCDASGTVSCDSGPTAIEAGNAALLCGVSYAGQYFEKNGAGQWVLKAGTSDSDLALAEYNFCQEMNEPRVTDPTDAPSDTSIGDTIPAILSGLGVEAQLGAPIKKMRVRLATGAPRGLVQDFGDQIRVGAMSFNSYGSATESSDAVPPLGQLRSIPVPKVCSNDPNIVCARESDCGTGSCEPTTKNVSDLDGSRILYPIGLGTCATMTSQACKTSTTCPSGKTCLQGYCGVLGETTCTTPKNCSGSDQACISKGVGSHTTSGDLVHAIDDIKAKSWTPLGEAFYDAIGYYAQIPTGTDAGKSRSTVRLNPASGVSALQAPPPDFDENYNPSEYRCQQNYVLLISDGSSTADRNATVNGVSALYASAAGVPQTSCTSAPTGSKFDYGGTANLPILTWLAKHRNIATFSLSGSASTEAPAAARDSITSYVVFNGEPNGASGYCNSRTLLSKAASNGGTEIKEANDPERLQEMLTDVFQEVAAKAASGTAASILSNSEGSGANILQAVFYPKKIFDDNTSVNWIGEMQNLWYYVDPYINNSTIREDSVRDSKLNLLEDKVVRFTFDDSANKTMVQLYQDNDGNGTGDTKVGGLVDPDVVKALWRAGENLWKRNISNDTSDATRDPRTIYTPYIDDAGHSATEVTFGGVASGLMKFDWSNSTLRDLLYPYLQTADNASALTVMKYVHGFDFPALTTVRSRTVKKDGIPANATDPATKGIGVWKLGDIISSTPRVQSTVRLGTYNLAPPGGYNDYSYLSYVKSKEYQGRGMVYVGANDGMLHAFKLGVLSVKSTGSEKATLLNDGTTELGRESWAFIPKHYLPYLKYLQDRDYQHLYGIDGRTLLVDASIGDTNTGTCVKSSYWLCTKPASVVRRSSDPAIDNTLDSAKNTWRTILIGGMGMGGASAMTDGTDTVTTPMTDPEHGTQGLGYSSYFALDVTDPEQPKLLWEFTHEHLGFSTTGPAIVRIGNAQQNGRWLAVFGSGPTGPIDTKTHQFLGHSSQPLRFFVVDLRTGALIKEVETGIADAFAGSLTGGAIDTDRWDPIATGQYQDDAIYVGYTFKEAGETEWVKGGVGRIMINRDQAQEPTAANLSGDTVWKWSVVRDDLGPVTTAISRLQDRKNRNLWLYGGTGRYFFRDSLALDDYDSQRMLFGIKEPCYNKGNIGNYLDRSCEDESTGEMKDQTTDIAASLTSGQGGWKILLDEKTTSVGAERLVTDTVALTNGTVFFTSFAPTLDACGYGGNSYLWGVKYDTGAAAPGNALTGKALIQLSTGEFKEVDLSTAFTSKANRRMASPLTGKPPSDAPPVISSSTNKPVKKILHIQEH